jgi:cytochrome c5
VFYDEYEQANLWGKDLYVHLSKVYKDDSKFCLMVISEHYAKKQWTNHERRAAQARAFAESSEYILPLRLDDAEIDGVLGTVGFLDYRRVRDEQIVESLIIKVRDYNKAHGIVFEAVRVQDVFAKANIPTEGKAFVDGDMRTTCPACHTEQRLNEAKISQEDAETFYTCKNGCQTLVVVSRPGETAWPGRGYRLDDYVVRNVRDIILKTDDMGAAVVIDASNAALMKKRPEA